MDHAKKESPIAKTYLTKGIAPDGGIVTEEDGDDLEDTKKTILRLQLHQIR
jgi:hypothetical protein